MSLTARTVEYLPHLPGSRPRQPSVGKPKKSFFYTAKGTTFCNDDPKVLNNVVPSTSLNMGRSTAGTHKKSMNNDSHFVTTFTGYFKESCYNTADENNRIRLCSFNYYTEDDTLELFEPRGENSAIPQGKFLRRHKVPQEDSNGYITCEDLDIGMELNIYGRNFYLVDANGSTRRYYEQVLGRSLGPAIGLPADAYTEKKKVQMSRETGRDATVSHHIMKNPMTSFAEAKLGKMIDHSAREGFLKYNRKVLRFEAVWDDRDHLYGDLLTFRIHYFLSDGTIEIAAVHTRNNGRDAFPLLLKRGKILKDETNYYTWKDMDIGNTINIYSRALYIIDADPFTRRFFEEQKMSLGERIVLASDELPRYQREIPPHTGYGSEEDSLTSCPGHSLVISRPRIVRDVREDRNLSYKALLVSDRPEDKGREFTVTYYTLDNTISIYEPPKRNSGILGGKFLSRREIKDIDNENMARDHFFVGNTVTLDAHQFLIVSADEPTLRYMERHRTQYPYSYIRGVMDVYAGQLREKVLSGELKESFEKHDAQRSGNVGLTGLRAVLHEHEVTADFGGQPQQALLTVMRYMGNGSKLEYSRFVDFIIEPLDTKLYANTAT